jgi:undecaprenyl diphosphate synthase
MQRVIDVREGCTVIVDPSADGRQRLLDAIEVLRDLPIDAIDETAIAGVLMAPAPVEPDLTIILGPREHLPPSLVWELAYSEIVSVDAHWNDLAAAHVEHAIDEFSRRHRRFGGLQ